MDYFISLNQIMSKKTFLKGRNSKMKKFLTVLLVIAVMFTFSFGSAFAAQTVPYEKNEVKDSLHYAGAYAAGELEDNEWVGEFGEYGITEAYKAELVKMWSRVADDSDDAIEGTHNQAANGLKVNSVNYYTAEKAEAKELVKAAVETFKTAKTAKDARAAETKLVAKLNKLTKTGVNNKMTADQVDAGTYLNELNIALGATLSATGKIGYLLPGYGYFAADTLDKAAQLVGAEGDAAMDEDEKALVYKWFIDNGYRTTASAKTHLADFKAALVALTTTEVQKIQAEYDAINAKAKAAADAFKGGSGNYGVATVDGSIDLAALDAIYAEEEAYEDKYCVSATDKQAGRKVVGETPLWQTWTSFNNGETNTQGYLVYTYENQYAAETKTVDLKDKAAVIALYDKIDDARWAFDYIDIAAPTTKEYAALEKAYDDFKDADEADYEDISAFEEITVVNATAGTVAYFDASEKNVKALEAKRAAYDELVKNYGYGEYNDAMEARILAGEHNKAAAAGYDEKTDKIDTSKVQAYLNNATVKVTTKALGNRKIRVNATIDATSFNYILQEMTDGCTVSYQFYHKAAAAKTYKASTVKDRNYITYTKKSLKKGTKYKFQCSVIIKDADGNVVAKKDYKASTIGSRVCR